MDEMDLLRDVLANPEPSTEAVVKRRRELQRMIRARAGSRGQRRRWWIAAGLTTAAAAAVTATVVLTQPAAPVNRPRPGSAAVADHPTPAAQSAQQILLMAATSAQRAPAGSGTYWHVRTRANWNGTGLTDAETWVTRDGQSWIRDQKSGAKPIKMPPPTSDSSGLGPFFLGGQKMTFSQIENLPTDPAALTDWIATNAAQHGGKSGGPAPDAARQREDVFESLDSLLSQLPTPPAVRAAAFRALAALPGVTALGPRDGGQAIQFTTVSGQQATLVVDPATGQIRATNFFVTNDGGLFWQPTVDATITCEWTDVLP
jgi:hypothetical protein